MLHKIKSVHILSKYILRIEFAEGVTKTYDMTKLIQENSLFKELKDEKLFYDVKVDVGGCGIIWNDDIDISCEELFANGNKIITPFDGLMAFSDATDIWGLNESTLRKAIA